MREKATWMHPRTRQWHLLHYVLTRRSTDLFAACDNFGLVISTEKTVVMHQPPPDPAYVAPQINVNGVQLQVVDNFTYLGSTLFRTTKIDDEVACRTSKTSQAFVRLQRKIWNRHGLHLNTNLKMYKTVILPMLLYERSTDRCTRSRRGGSSTSTSAVFNE
nr:unnamed protein product [Spirometra erinaceieuropaei]